MAARLSGDNHNSDCQDSTRAAESNRQGEYTANSLSECVWLFHAVAAGITSVSVACIIFNWIPRRKQNARKSHVHVAVVRESDELTTIIPSGANDHVHVDELVI